MSEFDKEAEREKLRKQFAEDETDRESTERMSELLLQGATMTNKHCDVHGDPIFRYDGEEFCPTCRAGGQETQSVDPAAGTRGDAAVPEETPTPNETPAPDTPPRSDAADVADGSATEPPASIPETPVESPSDATSLDGHDSSPRTPTPEPDATDSQRRSTPARGEQTHTDLGEARASLARTVTRFADEAERTDDLARSREYLAAVEDAANALAAVRDAEK
ncbi:Sjogren's syndrome/scleroderma autoantigen 1 family protein [Halomarina salina]|uniref:Sjogren's syndrome/scleroderma autoantigen 1 family protein n=1 Tax=Halomarina salina TaxID=1872699 RepID=A0ABD5RL96_9EURY|nr:Sjogren's syndrome/scleroderma autoantigen 1 family protein [Halomarina salina]